MRRLAEEDRTRRVQLDRDRDQREQRAAEYHQRRRGADVHGALEHVGGAGEVERRKPDQRDPLDGVHRHAGADDVEEARDDVDLEVEVAERADHVDCLLVRRVREGDHDTVDAEDANHVLDRAQRAEDGEIFEALVRLLRHVVDKPDDIDAVLRMLQELARDRLADVACSDDDRVLDVLEAPAADRACEGASRDYEHDREQPEDEQLMQVERRHVSHGRADKEDPGADCDEVKDAYEVVDGRVVVALFVVLVQPVEPCHHDPGREGERESEPFHPWADRVAVPYRRVEELGREEGQTQADEVCEDERAPDEPATPSSDVAALPAVHDLQGPFTDHVSQTRGATERPVGHAAVPGLFCGRSD